MAYRYKNSPVAARTRCQVDSVKAEKDTHLTDLLKRMRIWNFNGARALVELLLSENFDWDSDKTVVVEGLKLDVDDKRTRLSSTHAPDVHLDGEYITDSKLHCSFKNNAPETLPLEFYGPLLIDCGFPYTKDLVLKYLEKQIHPWEHEYLQRCIEETRSLKLICRDCLRRHFKRKIHHFVESFGLPTSLKDFILLKRELLTLK